MRGNCLTSRDRRRLQEAKARAAATPTCVGFTFAGAAASFDGRRVVWFKNSAGANDDPAWQTYYLRAAVATAGSAEPAAAAAAIVDLRPPAADVAAYAESRLVVDMATCTLAGSVGSAELPLPIGCYPCVDDAALRSAAHIAARMLECSPPSLRRRMAAAGACIGVIGKAQHTSDIPAHRFLRSMQTFDGRSFDDGCRGVGGVPGCACTSVGEENLLMHEDDSFSQESIMVHEFAHAVMNLGFDDAQHEEVGRLFTASTTSSCERGGDGGGGAIPSTSTRREGWLGELGACYMLSNVEEYWARPTDAGNTKGYSSTYLAMGFANVRVGTRWAGTRYPPEH